MNIPILTQLVYLIEEIIKEHGKAVAQTAEQAAIQSAEQDPKVQAVTMASTALLDAAQNLKTAINTPNVPVS